jgi:hypothetical protein
VETSSPSYTWLHVTVQDVNDHAPVFDPDSQHLDLRISDQTRRGALLAK